jgi:glycosyltransferase involved in cell wall biosynthesis
VAVAGASKRRLAAARTLVRRLGLGERYLVYSGRHDVRQDAATLLTALASLARAGRPTDLGDDVDWPPRLLVLDATPDDRAALARVAARQGAGDHLVYAPSITAEEGATIVAGSRGVILPVVADSSGSLALDALGAGVPVVASAVGALPENVGTAGILVEPRDPERLASAILAAWGDGPVRAGIAAAARERSAGARSWADVAADVRTVYAEVSRPSRL